MVRSRSQSRFPGPPGLRSPDPGGLLSRDEAAVDPVGEPMFEVGFPIRTWSRGLGGRGHRPRLRCRRAPDQCGWPRHARAARRELQPCVPGLSALPPTTRARGRRPVPGHPVRPEPCRGVPAYAADRMTLVIARDTGLDRTWTTTPASTRRDGRPSTGTTPSHCSRGERSSTVPRGTAAEGVTGTSPAALRRRTDVIRRPPAASGGWRHSPFRPALARRSCLRACG